MEVTSAPARRDVLSWQGLLLAVSLLIFWSQPTTTEVSVLSVDAGEGHTVFLYILNKPPNCKAFMWYRGKGNIYGPYVAFIVLNTRLHAVGAAYTGRIQILNDGTLMIRNVTLNDSGYYTVAAFPQDSTEEVGFGQLQVYQPVKKPTLRVARCMVGQNSSSVVLICETNATSIQWFFRGWSLELEERMSLFRGNRSLIINPLKREDAGVYRCEASNPISSSKSSPLKLNVQHEPPFTPLCS